MLSIHSGPRRLTRRANGQRPRRPASSPHKQLTGDDYTSLSTDFNTLWTAFSRSHLAFSTFQHRLASFNLPKIPIFRIWLDRFQLFLVGKLRSFPVFTLARYQRWAGASGRFPPICKKPTTRFHIAQTRRYIHGLTYTSFKLASS